MADDEITDFSARVDLEALRAYRAAVGRRTLDVVRTLHPSDLDQVLDPAQLRRVIEEGSLGERADWVQGVLAREDQGLVPRAIGTHPQLLAFRSGQPRPWHARISRALTPLHRPKGIDPRGMRRGTPMTLNDKVAIVTGGGRGLGAVYCRALAAEGASVVVADIVEDSARKVRRRDR